MLITTTRLNSKTLFAAMPQASSAARFHESPILNSLETSDATHAESSLQFQTWQTQLIELQIQTFNIELNINCSILNQ